MTEQAKAAQREYHRQWRHEHPEKIKEYRRRYWERKAQAEKHNHNPLLAAQIGGDRV